MISRYIFALFLCLFYFANAQKQDDLITNLPGLPSVNFSMYAGYISVTPNHHYFYWFVESSNHPKTDPVILWLNGGPGCSSIGGGLMTENGPFSPDKNGKLILNPYSWNTVANVLYLESPAGVGFSYCEHECGRFDDNKTADDNFQFLVYWFSNFSSFANNDFYIFGESYGGHYIPQLVYRIYQNKDASYAPVSNFKGFGAGNPLTDNNMDFNQAYLAQYMQAHGMLQIGNTDTNSISGNYDPYNILFDVCSSERLRNYIRFPHPFNNFTGYQEPSHKKRFVPNPPSCEDDFVNTYLNTPAIQQAIHSKVSQWTLCGGPPYIFGEDSMIPIYKLFVTNTNYKLLVYSGDQDTVLNFIATENILLSLNLKVTETWRAWNYQSPIGNGPQVGGWTVKFANRLRFATIKGAGHMVPQFQPAPSLQLLLNFFAEKMR